MAGSKQTQTQSESVRLENLGEQVIMLPRKGGRPDVRIGARRDRGDDRCIQPEQVLDLAELTTAARQWLDELLSDGTVRRLAA